MATLHSIVIPIFNEYEGLENLFSRLQKLADVIAPDSVEIVLVNDGSSDQSGILMDDMVKRDPRVRALHFSRNFGHQVAISAGIEWTHGQTITVMDADLQDPPEVILDLIKKWREGFDVVFAVRRIRQGETRFKQLTAKIFYRVIRELTNIDIPVDTGDFRLMDRRAADAFLRLRERHRFVRGMVSWVGFKQTGVLYDRAERVFGQTHYPFGKMMKFALDGITSFSGIPLQLATYLGLGSAVAAAFLGVWTIYTKFFNIHTIPGWSSLMLVCLFMGGVQLLSLGIIGEYLGRVYDEVKNRPLYIVDRAMGFERKPKDEKTSYLQAGL